MIWFVLLWLTFSDGSVVHKDNVTAKTEQECVSIVQAWKAEMHEKYKDQTDPKPSTFIVGCTQEKSP